jgi:hypothetical protein
MRSRMGNNCPNCIEANDAKHQVRPESGEHQEEGQIRNIREEKSNEVHYNRSYKWLRAKLPAQYV